VSAIRAEGLSKRYGSTLALDSLEEIFLHHCERADGGRG